MGRLTVAIARNQLTRVGVVPVLKAVLGRRTRAGEPWSDRELEAGARHISKQVRVLTPELPADLRGTVGLEIGPGESTALAGCSAARGAEMYAVDRLAPVDAAYTDRLVNRLGVAGMPADGEVKLCIVPFEDFQPPRDVDFVYSVDVIEHVRSPGQVFAHAFGLLRPGGRMVHSIDLAGHQIGDHEHLCCPDWLWRLAYSHVETTNRVRMHELVSAAEDAGFSAVRVAIERSGDVSAIRARILERWRDLPERELAALQILLTAVK